MVIWTGEKNVVDWVQKILDKKTTIVKEYVKTNFGRGKKCGQKKVVVLKKLGKEKNVVVYQKPASRTLFSIRRTNTEKNGFPSSE